MNDIDRDEARIARLLGAVRAPADPAVLTRARARLAEQAQVPGILAWLGTTRALVTACAVLVVCTAASVAVLRSDTASTQQTTLMAALIGDDGSYGLPTSSATVVTDAGVADSGTVTP